MREQACPEPASQEEECESRLRPRQRTHTLSSRLHWVPSILTHPSFTDEEAEAQAGHFYPELLIQWCLDLKAKDGPLPRLQYHVLGECLVQCLLGPVSKPSHLALKPVWRGSASH